MQGGGEAPGLGGQVRDETLGVGAGVCSTILLLTTFLFLETEDFILHTPKATIRPRIMPAIIAQTTSRLMSQQYNGSWPVSQ